MRFVPESNDRETPDLEGVCHNVRILCDAKTINVSDDEIRARRSPNALREVNDQLEKGFFGKLDSDIAKAKSQMRSHDPNGEAQHVVYFKICFGDWGDH